MIRSTVVSSIRAREYANYLAGRAQHEREVVGRTPNRGSVASYYADGDGVAEARWHGSPEALEVLGIERGPATADEIHSVLMGRNAATGTQVRKPGTRTLEDGSKVKVVNSHDLTPNVPKSFSVLWANSGPAQRALLEQMVDRSTRASMHYLFKNVATVQRRDDCGGRFWETAQDVVYCTTLHTTARAAKGQMPDPHLHVHCLVVGVMNSDGALRTPNNNKWVGDPIAEAGAFFRADLARQLRERGIELTYRDPDQKYFEIAGIPESLCKEMSKRTGEVDEKTKAFKEQHKRMPTARERADFAASTRQVKSGETIAELEPYWRARSREHGFDELAVAAIWKRRELQIGDAKALEQRIEQRIAKVSMVSQARARAIAFEVGAASDGARAADRALRRLVADGRLLLLDNGKLTARSTRHEEQRVLDAITDRSVAPLHPLAVHAAMDAAQDRLGHQLSQEQIDAIKMATGSDAVSTVEGVAGSGKGTVIEAVATAHRNLGQDVVVCAIQGARALEAGEQGRCDRGRSLTIDKLTYRLETGRLRLDAGGVIIVDEAGMVDTRRFADLLEAARDRDLRVVLVGDPQQLRPIEQGGMFPVIMERSPTTTLHEVHRAKHQWLRDAGLDFRNGNAHRAVEILQKHGAAQLHDDFNGAIQAAVERYEEIGRTHRGESRLIVVEGTNRHVDATNHLIQLRRLDRGELGAESIKAPDRDYQLHVGDQVMFRERAYRPAGHEPVANGTYGKVVCVDGDKLQIRVKEPGTGLRTVEVDTRDMQGSAVRLAYAAHVFPAQGVTVDHALCVSHPNYISRASSYVAQSRARESYTLFTTREDLALGARMTDAQCWNEYARCANRANQLQASVVHDISDKPLEPRLLFKVPEAKEHPRVELERLTQLHRPAKSRYDADRDMDFNRALHHYVRTEPKLVELTAIGPRPSGDGLRVERQQASWDDAARTILRYRIEHGIADRSSALGPAINRGSASERAAFDKALHRVDSAMRSLGREPAAPISINLTERTMARARSVHEGGRGLSR